MPDTKILKCSCESEFQDKLYGNHMRVHNHAPSKGSNKTRYRCATCKLEINTKEKE